MALEVPKRINPGDQITIDGTKYSVPEKTSTAFNLWTDANRPMPFVFLPLQTEAGNQQFIHATEIAAAIDSVDDVHSS